eukprot:5461798-Prymnesium_polylepis.1
MHLPDGGVSRVAAAQLVDGAQQQLVACAEAPLQLDTLEVGVAPARRLEAPLALWERYEVSEARGFLL